MLLYLIINQIYTLSFVNIRDEKQAEHEFIWKQVISVYFLNRRNQLGMFVVLKVV